jgi:hypothetical protein
MVISIPLFILSQVLYEITAAILVGMIIVLCYFAAQFNVTYRMRRYAQLLKINKMQTTLFTIQLWFLLINTLNFIFIVTCLEILNEAYLKLQEFTQES